MGDLYQTLGEAFHLLYEDLSERELLEIALSASPDRRALLAKRGNLPEGVALFLASDPSVEVRLALAGRKNLSDRLAKLLSRDPSHLVRERIAERRDVSREVGFVMAKDGSHFVLWKLATNPSIDWPTQKALFYRGGDELEEALRENVALHPILKRSLSNEAREPFTEL